MVSEDIRLSCLIFLHLVWSSLGTSTWLQTALFHAFYGWVIVHCEYLLHLLYPFICQWTFRFCFHILPLVNSAAENTGLYVSFWIRVLSEYMSKSGIARSLSSSSLLKNLPTVSRVAPPVYIPTNSIEQFVPFSSHPLWYLLFGGLILLIPWDKWLLFPFAAEVWRGLGQARGFPLILPDCPGTTALCCLLRSRGVSVRLGGKLGSRQTTCVLSQCSDEL